MVEKFEKEKTPQIGMKLSALTEDVLREVFLIYDRVVGGKIQQAVFGTGAQPLSHYLEAINEGFCHGSTAEFRFGSRLKGDEQMNAKFYVRKERHIKDGDEVIRVYFDPNIVETPEGKAMRDEFENAMNEYFKNKGLSVSF